jgi:hypothetical protein
MTRALGLLAAAGLAAAAPPNIVLILTDDQDVMLGGAFPTTAPGGATPLPRTRELLVEQGTTFTNFFVHTPICNPSRSELLTGRLFHNLKRVGGAASAMHVDERAVHNFTFARALAARGGYATGLFGKYLNDMPASAPPGFDAWLANAGGDYVAPKFETAGLEDACGLADGGWNGTARPHATRAAVGVSQREPLGEPLSSERGLCRQGDAALGQHGWDARFFPEWYRSG